MSNESEQIPEWLNNALFKKAIQSFKNDETIEIHKFEIKPSFGEHFGSKMYRSKIEFKSIKYEQNEVLSVVIKARPIHDPKLEGMVSDGPLFETEIEMYEKIIPTMQQLYDRHGIEVELAPELIYITTEPSSIIMLKDLTPDGYAVFKSAPEHFDDSKMFIKRLAQFHAASICLAETNEVDMTKYDYTIYKSENTIEYFMRDSIRIFKEVVAEWDGFDAYLPKIDELIEKIGEIGRKCYTPNQKGCGFNVLNHGDLHLRNILIKANTEQRIENFYFVDYQLCVWCSPVVDLTYAMGLFRIDQKADGEAEIILSYHTELENALKSLGFMGKIPSLLDVNIELLKHGAMNIAIWINFFPFLFIDWSKMNIDDLMGNDSERTRHFKKNMYNLPVLKESLQKNMKQWMLKGWW